MGDYPKGVRPSPTNPDAIQIRWQVHGRRHSEIIDLRPTETNLARAAKIRQARIADARYGTPDAAPSEITLAEYAQQWLESLTVTPETAETYASALNVYWSSLAGRPVAGITLAEIKAIDRSIDWRSEKTRRNAFTPLRQVFGMAVEDELRVDNPAAAVRMRRRVERSDPEPWTAEQRDAIQEWLDEHAIANAALFAAIGFGAGMRKGEILALQWQDIDRERGVAHVRRAMSRGRVKSTKTGASRTVALTRGLQARLAACVRRLDSPYVLTNPRGDAYTDARLIIQPMGRACDTLGIPRPSHSRHPWRATYASLALSAGASVEFVAAQIGDRVDTLLSHYAAYIPADARVREQMRLIESGSKTGTEWEHDTTSA